MHGDPARPACLMALLCSCLADACELNAGEQLTTGWPPVLRLLKAVPASEGTAQVWGHILP